MIQSQEAAASAAASFALTLDAKTQADYNSITEIIEGGE